MPSDARVQRALDALRGRRAAYRATVAAALARTRSMLSAGDGAERARHELGAFADMRIDVSRFAELSRGAALDAMARGRLERAADILESCAKAADEDFVVRVSDGATPHAVIASALARWGRAFGSSLAVELVRAGQYTPAQHDRLQEVWRFAQWSKAQRLAAPPIVVVVPGSDFRVADLCDFLDGTQHIALVVDGECPPAALVRAITPGTFVLQTSSDRGLDRFAAYDGPAIAALVPDGAACFVHDPEAGLAAWQRLQIWKRATDRPRSIAGLSAAQQREELLQLDTLSAQPAFPTTAFDKLGADGAGDPADRLTNWLLAQTGIGTVS